MEISPQDLSPQAHEQMLRAKQLIRTLKYLGTPVNTEQYDLPESPARDYSMAAIGVVGLVFGMVADFFLRVTVSWPDLLFLSCIGAAVGISLGYAARIRMTHQRNRERITQVEISLVRKKETDTLKQDYLNIIRDLIDLQSLQDDKSMRSIRDSLRLLGEAIEGLPPSPTDDLFLDPSALQQEAHSIAEIARYETDAVIAASLRRQEAALERRAGTISQTAVLVRRNQALRAEVTAQVRAIQTSIAAGRMNGKHIGSEFAAFADHVALVAQEATALSNAQAELEAALTRTDSHLTQQPSHRQSVEAITRGTNDVIFCENKLSE